jgi:tripeptidyl-peptidase-1
MCEYIDYLQPAISLWPILNTNARLSSHPESPNFGKHWTPEEVHEIFAPAESTVQAVRDWLVASGVEDALIVHTDNKGWLAFDIPTWQAEEIFQTEYHEHVHADTGNVRVGCDEYVTLCQANAIC